VEGKNARFSNLEITKTYYLIVENKNGEDIAGRKVFVPVEEEK
jgi:hypothetical protein